MERGGFNGGVKESRMVLSPYGELAESSAEKGSPSQV